MKKIFVPLLLILSFKAFAQAPTPPNYIRISARYEWLEGKFKTVHLPAGTTTPTLYGGWNGAGALYWDSVGKKLRIYNGSYWHMYVDSVYNLADSSIVVQYGTRKDTLKQKGGGGGGGGNTNTNIGSGYRWAVPGTNQVKTFFVGPTPSGLLSIDSTTNTNALTVNFDTTVVHTSNYNNGKFNPRLNAGDSSLKLNTTKDTIFYRNCVNVKSFGALDDGTTDNSTAFANAVATGMDVYIPVSTKPFKYSTGITLNAGQRIFGSGEKSMVFYTGTTRAITVSDSSVVENFRLEGNGKASGHAAETGVFAFQHINWQIRDMFIINFGGDSVAATGGGAIMATQIAPNNSEGGNIINCRILNNKTGIHIPSRGEYVNVTGCTSANNTVGIAIGAGNFTVTGSIFENNTVAAKVYAGTNNGHGVFVGCLFNHATYCIQVENVAQNLGVQFSACQLYFGALFFKGANNIRFSNCNISTTDSIHLDTTFNVVFQNCLIGKTNLNNPIPINKFRSSTDITFLGTVRYDTNPVNWIKQTLADTINWTGPIYYANGLAPVTASILDSFLMRDHTTGQLKIMAQSAKVSSQASSSTPTPNASTDEFYLLTALAANATFGAPTGSPTDGQVITIRIKDNGTPRTLTWNAIYRFGDVAAVATTVANKTLYCQFMYNAADNKWDQLGAVNNF